MFDSVYLFITTVPVEDSVLRAMIMVGEIFLLAAILHWLWESMASVFSRIAGRASSPSSTSPDAGALDSVHSAGLSIEGK